MKRRTVLFRTVGDWGCRETGKHYGRPECADTLDALGAALEAATGDRVSARVKIAADDVRVLGKSLRRIAGGEDARHVFAQVRPKHRANDRLRNSAIAGVYWRTLAEELAAGHADLAAKRAANKRARTYFRDKRISEQSVERISRAHYNIRDTTGAIVGRGNYRDFWLGALEIEHRKRRGPDIAPVRAYLKRHSKRGSL